MSQPVLYLNGVLALVEGLAYALTAYLVVRARRGRGGIAGQGRFVAWWCFASVGLLASSALILLGADGLGPVPAVTLSIFSLLIPLFGIALLVDHILIIAKGPHPLAPVVYLAYAVFFGVVLGTLLAAEPTGTVVQGARVELAFAKPIWIGFSAGIAAASLVPAVAAGWLWHVGGRLAGADRRRVRLVAASLLLWFVSKPLLAVPQQQGEPLAVLALRAAGLLSAALAAMAYRTPADNGQASNADAA